MLNKILLTPIDELVEIVRENKKCSVNFLKTHLNVSIEILERWLVILEEYKVLTVHYSGLEGYVTIIEEVNSSKNKNDELNIYNLKDRFIERSKLKEMNYDKMKKLWPVFILEYENEIKREFYEKAKNVGYDLQKIDKAWIRYKQDLEEL